jgi:hypothetical protein
MRRPATLAPSWKRYGGTTPGVPVERLAGHGRSFVARQGMWLLGMTAPSDAERDQMRRKIRRRYIQ